MWWWRNAAFVTYVGSSALVPTYVPEAFSVAARDVVQDARQVPFTALHRLEVPNAFELMVARKLITADERRSVLQQLHDDIDAQRLLPTALDLERLFADAAELSRNYSARFFCRSLDLLHVASAHLTLCKSFVSADDRQLRVARATGLTVIDIRRSVRRRRRSRVT
jgi:predicted nucleic acid-binding protein